MFDSTHLFYYVCIYIFSDSDIEYSYSDLHTLNYHLVSADLRNVTEFANKLKLAKVDFDLPTLFIAECVLVYIDPSATSCLLKYLANTFSISIFINYEQVNMQDNFGHVMLSNLRSRGCLLAGIESCISLDSQKER